MSVSQIKKLSLSYLRSNDIFWTVMDEIVVSELTNKNFFLEN